MKLINCLKKKSNDYDSLDRFFLEKTGFFLYEDNLVVDENSVGDFSVSIVIPCYNSSETVKFLLDSIEQQNFPTENLEVIVVDDGSTDNLYTLLEKILPQYVFASTLAKHRVNLGRSAARNSGAYLARNDVVMFLDSDVVLPNNFVFNHAIKHKYCDKIFLTSLREKRNLSESLDETVIRNFEFAGKKTDDWRYYAVLKDGRAISDIKYKNYLKDFGYYEEYESKTLPEMAISTAISIRRDRYFEIGGFCQEFQGWGREDVFFGAMALAHDCFIVPEFTTVYQLKRTTEDEEKAKKKERDANMVRYNNLLQRDVDDITTSNQTEFLNFYSKIDSIKRFRPRDQNLPTASIIISVCNDDRITRSLESLSWQSIDSEKFEIIVVENGPQKKYEALSQNHGAKYAYVSKPSIPKARNIGINMAEMETIIFTDADCVLPYHWLEEMLKELKNNRIVGGPIRNFVEPSNPLSKYGQAPGHGQKKPNYLPILNLPYFVGANVGFYREDLRQMRGMDENLLSGSDVDICYRLGLEGIDLSIARKADLYHEDRTSLKKYFYRFHKYALYQSALFKKYREESKKMFFVNSYPTKVISQGLFNIGVSLFELKKDKLVTNFLNVVEGVALIAGYTHGLLKYGVIYVP